MPVEEIQRKKAGCFPRTIKVLIETMWFSVLFGLSLSLSFNLSPCHKVVKKRNTGVLN